MIAEPLKVREFIDEITRGGVLLPEIQRSYVWKGPQAAKLIDSLYRQYPAGQILLWNPKGLEVPVTKTLAGIAPPRLQPAEPPRIVLDGQQRLTSLYKALGNHASTDSGINVYFHLETEQFQLFLSRMRADPLWVPVRGVVSGTLDDYEIMGRIAQAGGPSPRDPKGKLYRDRLRQLRQIAEYQFPIEVFASEDYEQVTELFVRINGGGTRLREAELALAQLALRLPGAIVEKFDRAMDEYAELDYDIDTRFLIRALIVIATGQSRFRYLTEFWKMPAAEVERFWLRTRSAVDSAVNFVRHNARFETSDWVPSLTALIPLVVYFDRYSKIAPNVEVGLLRWFYLQMSGHDARVSVEY